MDAPHHPVLRSRCVAIRVLVPKRERVVYCLGGQLVETNFLVHAWQVFLCVRGAAWTKAWLVCSHAGATRKGADDNAWFEENRVKQGRRVWNLISFWADQVCFV